MCSKNLSLTALTSDLGPMSRSRCAIDSSCARGIVATTAGCSSHAAANFMGGRDDAIQIQNVLASLKILGAMQ